MLALPQELTQTQATACLATLLDELGKQPAPNVVVDASSLRRFDSSALAVLLEFRRHCGVLGKQFSIRGLPNRLRDLAVLYGIADLLPTV